MLYAEATDELVQLAEFLQAPVMTTLPGKSAFPEHHPLAVGASGPSTTQGVHLFLMRADLVCGVGCSFTKTNFAVPIPPGKRLVHLTNDDDANAVRKEAIAEAIARGYVEGIKAYFAKYPIN